MTAPAVSTDKPALDSPRTPTGIPNGVLGMIIFILVEIMFFAALVSALLIVKSGAGDWPPPDQPRLPVAATALNTLILLVSGITAWAAGRTYRKEQLSAKFIMQLQVAIGLGTFFMLAQGYEWTRMLSFGLTMISSTYGAFFYLIIGTHALHVLCSIFFLFYALIRARKGTMRDTELWTAQAFWYFVVGVWPILYVLVYLF